MQPGPNPENIDTILSRFHTWAEKQPANGNGNGHKNGTGSGELREMSYEEAILQHRNRRPAPTPRRAPSPAKSAAIPEQKPASIAAPPSPPEPEIAPDWVANLPVVSVDEPVEGTKTAVPHPLLTETENVQAQPTLRLEEKSSAPAASAKTSSAKRTPAAKKVKAAAPKQASIIVAAPEVSIAPTAEPVTATTPAPMPARRASAKLQPAKIVTAEPVPATPRPIVAAAVTAKPVTKTAKTTTKSAISGSPRKIAMTSPTRTTALPITARKTVAVSARTHKPKRPPFRQVLANSVQQPKTSAAPHKKPAPDRTRRITTRFSPAEERRIEKQAAELGINVSAYLRQCALAASAAQNALAPAVANAPGKKKAPKSKAEAPAESRLYYAPTGSFLGGWLALLRNRFLGPTVRFSEQA